MEHFTKSEPPEDCLTNLLNLCHIEKPKMKIKLILVGRTVEKYLQQGTAVYEERLKHYVSFEVIVIPDIKQTSALTETQIKEREGESVMKQIKPADRVVLLDERGRMMSSIEWARDLENKGSHLQSDLVFVIGGPYGFSGTLYERANEKISLSKMTFSHQMVRLIFLEQLYRAYTIIKGEPYHHE